MRPREREPLSEFSDDTHSLLLGTDEPDDESFDVPSPRLTRSDRRRMEHAHRSRHVRHVRRGRVAVLLVAVLVVVIAVVAVPRVIDYFGVKDYSGSGYGSVEVTISSGASASDIGDALHQAGVVESTEAFTDAASGNSKAAGIQPGTYRLKKHMSGASALTLLLDPSSRDTSADIAVPEGATSLAVRDRLVQVYGKAKAPVVDQALNNPKNLALPRNYGTGSHLPGSAEGFLYPATYTPVPGSSPVQTLQAMVTRFIAQDRQTNFAGAATKVGITPYQALTIASIAQAEAKYSQDMPKVARTILNRLEAGMPLQSDATSAYGARVKGLDLKKVIYSRLVSPYNSYLHRGLPPTPIDNPGADAMKSAVHPASGNWLYFVNKDKAGHLGFFHSQQAFHQAAARCAKNHWGCAG